MVEFQEEETEIEVIEYTTTTSSKKEVIESKTPIISGQVVELGSRTKQSEVSFQKIRLSFLIWIHRILICLSVVQKRRGDRKKIAHKFRGILFFSLLKSLMHTAICKVSKNRYSCCWVIIVLNDSNIYWNRIFQGQRAANFCFVVSQVS